MRGLNKVFLNDDGHIEVLYAGNQTKETIEDLEKEIAKLSKHLRSQNKSVKILVNLMALSDFGLDVRRASVQGLQKRDYNYMAMYGVSLFAEARAELIVKASGRVTNTRIFQDRISALTYLKKEKSPLPKHVRPAIIEEAEDYYKYVSQRISELQKVISLGIIGEYSGNIPIPNEDDEFLDIFVGIQVLMQTLEEKRQRLSRIEQGNRRAEDVKAKLQPAKSSQSRTKR